MIQQDKFGNPIYYSRFRILLETANILQRLGYQESIKKPNLFFKKTNEECFFADMRGTEEVPIWKDTAPLFYWMFEKEVPYWKQRRLLAKEVNILNSEKCPYRLSFDSHHNVLLSFESSDSEMFTSFEDGVFDWEDGFCKKCNKDFQDNGRLCPECSNN